MFTEVDYGVVGYEVRVLKGGFDDEIVVPDEDVFVGCGRHLELAVAEAADFGFFGPDLGVETMGEVVFVDQAVGVIYDCAEAIPDQEGRDCDADC